MPLQRAELTVLCHVLTAAQHSASLLAAGLTKATNTLEDGIGAVRLWTHEALRVFHDRLTDDEDRVWFGKLLCEVLEGHFGEKGTTVFGIDSVGDDGLITGTRGLLFGDFMVSGADPKPYKCGFLWSSYAC